MTIRILVVDDSPIIRAMIRRTIDLSDLPAPLEVSEATDGEKALEALHAGWMDLVITDLHMPRMDGQTLIATMRAQELLRDIPVVVVSSNQSDPIRASLEAAGCRYLKKPFKPEQLSVFVRELLHLTNGAAHVG